jgi:hypothetical protein
MRILTEKPIVYDFFLGGESHFRSVKMIPWAWFRDVKMQINESFMRVLSKSKLKMGYDFILPVWFFKNRFIFASLLLWIGLSGKKISWFGELFENAKIFLLVSQAKILKKYFFINFLKKISTIFGIGKTMDKCLKMLKMPNLRKI